MMVRKSVGGHGNWNGTGDGEKNWYASMKKHWQRHRAKEAWGMSEGQGVVRWAGGI